MKPTLILIPLLALAALNASAREGEQTLVVNDSAQRGAVAADILPPVPDADGYRPPKIPVEAATAATPSLPTERTAVPDSGIAEQNSGLTSSRPEERKTVAAQKEILVAEVASPAQAEERETVYFDYDKTDLDQNTVKKLDRIARAMKNAPEKSVVIEAHTDSRGSEAYNLGLSDRRANAVRKYFVQKGIESRRIVTRGLGEGRPAASNETDRGRALNRRAEIRLED